MYPLKRPKETFCIKLATIDDVPIILGFIKELAKYERLSHEIVATEALLRDTLFGERQVAEVLIGYCDQRPVWSPPARWPPRENMCSRSPKWRLPRKWTPSRILRT